MLCRAFAVEGGEGVGEPWRGLQAARRERDSRTPIAPSQARTRELTRSRLQLGAERHRAPELLFTPELVGLEYAGVHQVIIDSINCADLDLRKSLFGNVVLSGGNTIVKGALALLSRAKVRFSDPRTLSRRLRRPVIARGQEACAPRDQDPDQRAARAQVLDLDRRKHPRRAQHIQEDVGLGGGVPGGCVHPCVRLTVARLTSPQTDPDIIFRKMN